MKMSLPITNFCLLPLKQRELLLVALETDCKRVSSQLCEKHQQGSSVCPTEFQSNCFSVEADVEMRKCILIFSDLMKMQSKEPKKTFHFHLMKNIRLYAR